VFASGRADVDAEQVRSARAGKVPAMNDMADAGSSLVKVLLDWQQEIGQLLQQIPIESHPG
jgi:hypothetical protein